MTEKNNILLINDIIYKIYTIEDLDDMRKSVLESMQFLIPCPVATFYLGSDETPYELCRPIGIGLPEERWQIYLDDYQAMDYTRWTFAAPIGQAVRETDLLQDEVREQTPYYQALFAPSNIHYSAMLTIIYNGTFLGVINLFRKREEGDFTDEEMFLLGLLKDHLAYRLFMDLKKHREKQSRLPTQEELIETYHLTLREIEIIYLLLDGISRENICEKLCISANTLKKHTVNIYKKLNIKSWRELFQLLK